MASDSGIITSTLRQRRSLGTDIMGVRGNNFRRTYKEMSAARDATQTVKQKFDVLTELIEDIDQKMDLIVARINTEAPRETPTTPPAREKFRLSTRLTVMLAASVATVFAFTARAHKSS